MKTVYTIFSVLILFTLLSCNSKGIHVSETEKDGVIVKYKGQPYSGKVHDTYENGTTKEMISYKEGLKDGPLEGFYEDGKIKEKENYVNGFLNGISEYYDPNGLIYETKEYKPNSVRIEKTYDTNGKEITNGVYINNNPYSGTFKGKSLLVNIYNGYSGVDYQVVTNETFDVVISKYDKGNLVESTGYSTDFKILRYKQYNGQSPNGDDIVYFANGKIHYKRSFNMWIPTGTWETYNQDGALILKGEFENGKPKNGKFLSGSTCCNDYGSYYRYDTFKDGILLKSEESNVLY